MLWAAERLAPHVRYRNPFGPRASAAPRTTPLSEGAAEVGPESRQLSEAASRAEATTRLPAREAQDSRTRRSLSHPRTTNRPPAVKLRACRVSPLEGRPYSRITRLYGGRRSASPQPNAVPGSQARSDPTRTPGWKYKPILLVLVVDGGSPSGLRTLASRPR